MDHSLDPRVQHVVATVHKVIMFQNHSEPSLHADSVLALATTGCLMTQLPEIVQEAVSIGRGRGCRTLMVISGNTTRLMP